MRGTWMLFVMLAVRGLAAAPIDDFKAAVDKKGCDSIPYSSTRSTCSSKSSEVDNWCKNSSKPISCDGLDPSALSKQITNVKDKIEALKRERSELSSKISNAKDDSERRDLEARKKQVEDEIYELEKKVAEWERKLSDERNMINDRIYNGERCVTSREEVARSFQDAKSSARGESDPDIRPLAQRLIAYWESEEPNHADAISKYKRALEKCRGMR